LESQLVVVVMVVPIVAMLEEIAFLVLVSNKQWNWD
jgi:hypothetical protein